MAYIKYIYTNARPSLTVKGWLAREMEAAKLGRLTTIAVGSGIDDG